MGGVPAPEAPRPLPAAPAPGFGKEPGEAGNPDVCAQPLDAFSGEQKESVSGVSTRECGPDGAASRGLGPPAALLRSEPGRGGHAASRRAPRREAGPPSSLAGDLTAPAPRAPGTRTPPTARPVPARRLLLQTGEESGAGGPARAGAVPSVRTPSSSPRASPRGPGPGHGPPWPPGERTADSALPSPGRPLSAPTASVCDPQPPPSRRAQFASGFRPPPRHPSGLSGRAEAAALELCGARGASPRQRGRTVLTAHARPRSARRPLPLLPGTPHVPRTSATSPARFNCAHVAGSLGITLCTLSFPHTT